MIADVPGMGHTDCVLTLGYDPAQKKFIGTFIASMMTHLWLYNGSLDATGKILALDTVGPSFGGDGTMNKFQDIYAMIDNDHRTLTGQMLTAEGKWQQFMKSTYRRIN